MFWHTVFTSFWALKKLVVLVIIVVALGISLAWVFINGYLDITDEVEREKHPYRSNVVAASKDATMQPESAMMNYEAKERRIFLLEEDLYEFKKIFSKYNIVGFSPYLRIPVEILPGGQELILTGTLFTKELEVPQEDFKVLNIGIQSISSWWQVEGNRLGDDDPSEVVIGTGVANGVGLMVGDVLTVRYKGMPLVLKVTDIYNPGDEEDKQVFIHLPVVQELTGLTGKVAQLKMGVWVEPIAVTGTNVLEQRGDFGINKIYHSLGKVGLRVLFGYLRGISLAPPDWLMGI